MGCLHLKIEFLIGEGGPCPKERGARDVRARAQAALEDMTPANLFRCGLTCDYTMECLKFLRESFDIDDPDPASTCQFARAFCARMKTLFVEGYILGSTAPASAAPAAPEDALCSKSKTITEVVFEQVDFPEPKLGHANICWVLAFFNRHESVDLSKWQL